MIRIENPKKRLLGVGVPDRIEESVCRVATCSSTKNRLVESSSNKNSKNKRRSIRESRESELDPSDFQQLDESRETQPIATSENAVGTNRILKDISEEVKQ